MSPLGATKASSPFLGSKCFSRANPAMRSWLRGDGIRWIGEWMVVVCNNCLTTWKCPFVVMKLAANLHIMTCSYSLTLVEPSMVQG
jgi:hypothetical protein